jgi:O-antigen ligase
MFAARPILGWGLGNFTVAYPQYKTFYTNLFVNAAHNDYLQALTETGVLGFVAIIWFLVALYRTALKKLRSLPRGLTQAATLAALLGISGILVHSFSDFNLQVPANAAIFYVLCAIAGIQVKEE